MTTQNPSQPSDLFFEPIVNGYLANPRFVRRDWLAEEIDHRLSTDSSRFVLLTAEPGFGKSVFMAQLAGDHPDWPRYFIRRDQRAPLSDVGARSFLLRIGFQLAALYPELFTTDAIRLTVEQRVGALKDGGSLVGAEIGKILASPFYEIIVQIQQQIEQVGGKVVGLHIAEMVIEPRQLELADLQYMALIDPARAMQRLHPERQIVIALDALDEIQYHQTDDNILAWLANCPELPPNVRFVLTSRPPEGAVRLFMDKQQSVLQVLAIAARDRDETTQLSGQIDKDLEAYADKLAGDATIKTHLDGLPGGAAGFKQQAVAKADGNIGYLDALARAIDQALVKQDSQILAALLAVKYLPDDMQGLYAFFIHQIKGIVGEINVLVELPDTGARVPVPMWSAVYEPLLAVLAVAREPVTLEQIRYLGGITAGWADLNAAKDRLLQFLDIVEGRYRLYHATLPEFLTDEHTRHNTDTEDLYVDAKNWHRRISDRYWRSHSQDWSQCDSYGLRALAMHLSLGEQFDRLAWLIDQPWMKARFDGGGYTYDGFISDVMLAMQHAHDDAHHQIEAGKAPSALAVVVRYLLITTTINSIAADLVPQLVTRAIEVGLWGVDRGISMAARIPDVAQRVDLCGALLSLPVLNASDRARIEKLALAAIDSWPDPPVYPLTALATQLDGSSRDAVVHRALTAATQTPEVRAGASRKQLVLGINDFYSMPRESAHALAAVARLLSGEERDEAIRKGLAFVDQISDPKEKAYALGAWLPLLSGLLREDLSAEASAAAKSVENLQEKMFALAAVAASLDGDARSNLVDLSWTLGESIDDEPWRAFCLSRIAPFPTGERRAFALALASRNLDIRSFPTSGLDPKVIVGRALELLRRCAPGFSEVERTRLVAVVDALPDASQRLDVKVALGLAMSDEEMRLAVDTASKTHRWERDTTLAMLSPRLPGELVRQALESLIHAGETGEIKYHPRRTDDRESQDVFDRLRDTWRWRPASPDEVEHDPDAISTKFELIENIDDPSPIWADRERSVLLTELVRQVPDEAGLSRAWHLAQRIGDGWYRSQPLTELAWRFDGDRRQEVLSEAVEAVFQTGPASGDYRAAIIERLAPLLPSALLERTLNEIVAFDEWSQIRALGAVLPYVRDSLTVTALDQVGHLSNDKSKRDLLELTSTHWPTDLWSPALQVVDTIGDEEQRAAVLATFALHSPTPMAEPILGRVDALHKSRLRAVVLSRSVAAGSNPELLESARRELLEALRSPGLESRAALISFLNDDIVFREPILDGDCLHEIKRAYDEITEKWQWM